MITRRMQKFEFDSEESAKAFAKALEIRKDTSDVEVSGNIVYWVESSTD
jgi:hypothetical protein